MNEFTEFDSLIEEIELAVNGTSQSIPIGLARLGRYINLRKRILTLIFSSTGCGKSGLLDTIIQNSCEDYMNHPSPGKLKPDFQLFSMERAKRLRIAKWTIALIFKNEEEVIELHKMM